LGCIDGTLTATSRCSHVWLWVKGKLRVLLARRRLLVSGDLELDVLEPMARPTCPDQSPQLTDFDPYELIHPLVPPLLEQLTAQFHCSARDPETQDSPVGLE